MTRPPLTHPATNPDGTCDDQSCPCHEFTRMPTATITHDDTISDCEPTRESIFDTPLFTGANGVDEACRTIERVLAGDSPAAVRLREKQQRERESTALRNTRSIVHHAEMVQQPERKCILCGHHEDVDGNGLCIAAVPNTGECRDTVKWRACNCKCVFLDQTALRGLREALKDNNHALFSDAWDFAPADIRRVTEQECAEFFYELGRRDERRLLAETTNEDLRELQRVARERLR